MQRSQLLILVIIVTTVVLVNLRSLELFDDQATASDFEAAQINRLLIESMLLTIIMILLMREPMVVITDGHDR